MVLTCLVQKIMLFGLNLLLLVDINDVSRTLDGLLFCGTVILELSIAHKQKIVRLHWVEDAVVER